MGLVEILTDMAEGLAAFVPAFGKSIWQLFLNMFCLLNLRGLLPLRDLICLEFSL